MVRSGSRRGASLAEATIALLILSIGLLTTIPLAVRSLARVREAVAVEHSSALAIAILDSLAQLRRPGAGAATVNGVAYDWAVVAAGSMRIELHAVRTDERGLHADTLVAFGGLWPRRLHAVP